MASVNKVILIGNLGKDPETKYLASGDSVTNITMATTENWKDKTGEKQERVEWHRVTFYRKLAEIAGQYLKKGNSVYVEGRLETRKWTDKSGVERYTTEIIANEMVMLGGKSGSTGSRPIPGDDPSPHEPSKQAKNASAKKPDFDDAEDDIPF